MSLKADHSHQDDGAAGSPAVFRDVDLVALLDQLPDEVVLVDRDGHELRSSGRGIDLAHDAIRAVIATGRPDSALVTVADADGATRSQVANISAVRSTDGSVCGAMVVLRDDVGGDLDRFRDEVIRRDGEFRALADNMPDVVLRYDAEGRVTYANRHWSETLGQHPSLVMGKRPTESSHSRSVSVDEYEAALMRVLETGDAGSVDLRIIDATGDRRTHHVLFRALRGGDGSITGAVAIGRDVTDLERARAESMQREREFRTLAENLPDVVVRYDRDGRVAYLNHRLGELTEVGEDMIGTRPTEHALPGVLGVDEYEDVLLQVIATGESAMHEVRQVMPSGEMMLSHVLLRAERDEAGEIVGAIAIGRDVTDLVTARQRAADREREFRSLAENATDFIARWDTNGIRRYVNPALARLHARPTSELVGRPSDFLGDRSNMVGPAVHGVIRDHEPRLVQQRIVDPDSGELLVHEVQLVPEFGPDGELVSVLGIGRDVTDVLRQRDELARAANTDLLTGAASRAVLYERLPRLIADRVADGAVGAVLLLDLDGFKSINDHFGHHIGDRILQEVAAGIADTGRSDDLLVRLGGDEFVLVLPEVESPTEASLIAHRARCHVISLSDIDGTRVPSLDVCMGIAFFPSDGADIDELLSHADLALYEAKRRGRGHAEYFQRDLRAALDRRTTIEHALRSADLDIQMSLHLQPICRLGAEPSVWGVEALLRWEHPELGQIRPDEFIPIAEQSGDIIPLGRWVLRRAAEVAVEINRGREVPLEFAVNVSSRQFTLGGIEGAVRDAVVAADADPSWFTIELTESLLLEDVPEVSRSIRALHDLGVAVAVDDFGTGYSALQYLTRLDIDYVKIDRSFVHDSDVDVQRREIVRAIAALAAALGIGIVAEGIETNTQAEFLRELGCGLGQGYLLASPMPVEHFEQWLATADTGLRAVLNARA